MISLWHFVLKNAWKDANLEPWGDDGIEEAARWDGKSGAFVAAIREAKFIDGFIVHDWLERAGKLVLDRMYNEERRKNGVKRRKTEATQPYPTLPNPTQPINNLEDAGKLVAELEHRLEANGVKAPLRKKAIRDADLLLRVDSRPIEEALAVLRWATDDSFWKSNILSIGKFRQKYDQLKLRMQNGSGRNAGHAAPVHGKYGD